MFFLPALAAGLGSLFGAAAPAAAAALPAAAAGTAAAALPAAATTAAGLGAAGAGAAGAAGAGLGAAGTAAGALAPTAAELALGGSAGLASLPEMAAAAAPGAIETGMATGINAAMNPGAVAGIGAGGVGPTASQVAGVPGMSGALAAPTSVVPSIPASATAPGAVAGVGPGTWGGGAAAGAAGDAAATGGGLSSFFSNPTNLMMLGGAASMLPIGGGGGEGEDEEGSNYKDYKPWSAKRKDPGPGYNTRKGEHRYFAAGGMVPSGIPANEVQPRPTQQPIRRGAGDMSTRRGGRFTPNDRPVGPGTPRISGPGIGDPGTQRIDGQAVERQRRQQMPQQAPQPQAQPIAQPQQPSMPSWMNDFTPGQKGGGQTVRQGNPANGGDFQGHFGMMGGPSPYGGFGQMIRSGFGGGINGNMGFGSLPPGLSGVGGGYAGGYDSGYGGDEYGFAEGGEVGKRPEGTPGPSMGMFGGAVPLAIEQVFGGGGSMPGLVQAFGGDPFAMIPGLSEQIKEKLKRNDGFAEGGEVGGEREIVAGAVAAIQGQHPDPKMAIEAFISVFGAGAFEKLVDEVRGAGKKGSKKTKEPRAIMGPGDGTSDDVPAEIDGSQPASLSSGEFVVPADVVSGLGNGDSKAGVEALHEMMNRVRSVKTGDTQQPPDLAAEKVMPV